MCTRIGIGILLAGLALILATPPTSAEELTGRQLAEKVDDANRARSEVASFEMKIVNRKGKEKIRTLKSWVLSPTDAPEKAMVRFLDPPDVAGTSVLTIEQEGEEDEQWMYLPALKRTRRIAGSQKNESFMGSDLSYDDLRPRDIDAYDYEILRREKLEGAETWVLQSAPRPDGKAADSEYSKTISWIDQANFVPLKTELYDRKDQLYKVITYGAYQEDSGVMRPDSLKVEDRLKGSHTVIRYQERELNTDLDETLFTTRALETEAL